MIDKTKALMMSDVNGIEKDGICRVIVHNVEKVPLTERFRGYPDPYVNVFYHGSLYFDIAF